MGCICPLAIDFIRALGCKSVWRLTQVVGGCTIGRQGKWGELSATLVVAGSSQSPHSSALMTYDGNDEQNRLLDQSLGELCRRDKWSSLQSVLSENAVVAKHGLVKGGRKEDVGSRYFQHRYQCSNDGTAMQFTDTLSSSIDKSAALVPLAKRVAAALRRNWRGAQAEILTVDMLDALGNGVKEVRSCKVPLL